MALKEISIVACLVGIGCGVTGGGGGDDAAAQSPLREDTGASLYQEFCSSCHGDLAESDKIGRSAEQITAAIAQVSSMSQLASLTQEQIVSIAEALMEEPEEEVPDESDEEEETPVPDLPIDNCLKPLF